MMRHSSVAALTLRLTWVRALGAFAIVGVLQWLLAPFDRADSYEDLMRNVAWAGKTGFLALVVLLLTALMGYGKSSTTYTWRRLRIPETRATVISGLVISGWFFLYWAFQLALCLGLYVRFNGTRQFGTEYLMLSAFRCEYLRALLPIGEPWSLLRNVVIYLLAGNLVALTARMHRSGRNIWGFLYLYYLVSKIALGAGEIATKVDDIVTMVLSVLLLIAFWYWNWRWMKHEAP